MEFLFYFYFYYNIFLPFFENEQSYVKEKAVMQHFSPQLQVERLKLQAKS